MGVRIVAVLALSSGLAAFASVTNTMITVAGSGSTTALSTNTYSYSGTGTATLIGFGNATFSARGQATVTDNVAGPTVGTMTFDFGGGNTMTGTFSVPSFVLAPNLPVGGFQQVSASASITGGTGSYAGASSTLANITGKGTATGATSATFFFTASGAVTLQGGSTPTPTSATYVYNAASWVPPGLPNSAIAQGSIFVVKTSGVTMGPATLVQAGSYPLPSSAGLAGTTVQVSINGSAQPIACIMIYTVSYQIAAILPSNTPAGTGTLTISYQNKNVASIPIQVVARSFGIFTVNQAGGGAGVLSDVSYHVKTALDAAHAGDVLIIWGTGLGPVTGDEAQPPTQVDLGTGAQVYFGSKQATVLYAGRGSSPGLDQINVIVPGGIAGCYVPVTVKVGSVVSNVVGIAIAPSGQTVCSDPAPGFAAADLQKLQSTGSLKVADVSLNRSLGSQDKVNATFYGFDFRSFISSVDARLGPSFGTCTAFEYLGDKPDIPNPGLPPGLVAGPQLTISGPGGSATVGLDFTGVYSAKLGGGGSGEPTFFSPGATYTVNGPGGSDVGLFSTSIAIEQPVVWTNMPAVVSRSQDLSITWTGGGANDVLQVLAITAIPVAGSSTFAFTEFACQERTSAGQITLPANILSLVPQNGTIDGSTSGLFIEIASIPFNKITAPGIDFGYIHSEIYTGTVAAIK